jgi:hypothetical protein
VYTRSELNALAPNRITPGDGDYDGAPLFFREQKGDTHGIPRDLVGNVAQYVFDSPAQIADVKTVGISLDDARKLLSSESDKLFVIGGSALSPPTQRCDTKLRADWNAADRSDGYSDVGFRLAFTAPIEPIPEGLVRIRGQASYLAGPKFARQSP